MTEEDNDYFDCVVRISNCLCAGCMETWARLVSVFDLWLIQRTELENLRILNSIPGFSSCPAYHMVRSHSINTPTNFTQECSRSPKLLVRRSRYIALTSASDLSVDFFKNR